MKFKPLHDRLLLKPMTAETKTKAGIIIPDTAQEKPMQGEVVAVGKGKRLEDGRLQSLDVKVGDKVRHLLDRLLAHDRHARQDLGQARGQPLFGRDVGHGDEVTRALQPDVFLGERAEARQQLGRRRLTHQLGDTFRIGRAQHVVSRRCRTGPLPSGSRARRRRA